MITKAEIVEGLKQINRHFKTSDFRLVIGTGGVQMKYAQDFINAAIASLSAEENMAELDAAIALSESEQYRCGVDAGIAGVADIWEQALTGATPKQGVLGDERIERLGRMTEALRFKEPAADGWQPIETAPKETKQMFVVIAFSAIRVGATTYDSDPWCVWHGRGRFVRWPHKFEPTHWMPLPPPPQERG